LKFIRRSHSGRGLSKPIKIILYSLLLLLMIYSGIDTYFDISGLDGSGTLGFISAMGMNLLFLLFSIISILIAYAIFFLGFDRHFSDRKNATFALVLSTVFVYIMKSLLINSYGIVFALEPVIIIAETSLMGFPVFIVFTILKDYGKGFLH